ncbi:hypothetical protein P167DRAFT_191726 [Morchella conica CCBAS932]|uniref:Uncharacterized protein n=1 Tax=Morchella conica CCBAS932 TaxID=1392247 RepID=A0A3N4L4Q8_9PEZI|nr:hypothetical protein P167DRAFT_191726 [Morchella conica CCBAS932]
MGYRSLTRRIKRLLSTRPNFMAMHYYYLGLCILLGSILIYIPGGVPFVDAIFFASGAATQSGLNTQYIPANHNVHHTFYNNADIYPYDRCVC